MDIKVHAHDAFSEDIESAILVSDGIIHPSLAAELPQRTTFIIPLTSADDCHIYRVQVFGYTIDQFVAIVKAYADQQFALALQLVEAIKPVMTSDDENYEG